MSRIRTRSGALQSLPFDLGSLEVFLAVCETGGMAAAARRLGLTQPAVSQTIADLEQKLEARLFERDTRPLALTAPGGMVKQRALSLLAEARQLVPAIRESQHGKLPLVRVGLVDSLTRALTVPATSFLLSKVGQITIYSGFTDAHAQSILNRNTDISIGIDALADMEGIERHVLIEEPFIIITPKSVEMEATRDLTALACQHPLVRYSARSQTGRQIDRHLRRVRLEVPRTREYDTPIGVTEAVAADAGWAITTPLCAFEGGLDKPLRFAPLPTSGLSRKLFLLCRRNELGTLPRLFAQEIRKALENEVIPTIKDHMPWLADTIRCLRN